MSDDYRVKGLSNAEIRQLAKRAREFFGVNDHRHVDVLACLRRPSLWTVRGERRLIFRVKSDSEMGDNDGQTTFSKGAVSIDLKQSVHDAALVGVGRPRNTCAHELGHAVMHDGPVMARRATLNVTPKWIQPFESAEHQAKIFAPAFLINDALAETQQTPEEMSIEFGISLESAKIYYQQILESRDRKASEERVLRMAQDFRARTMPPPHTVRYLQELCTVCGNRTVLPLGIKFMCVTCDTVFDRFQDGDSVE